MSLSKPLRAIRSSALAIGLLALLTFGAGIVVASTLRVGDSAAHDPPSSDRNLAPKVGSEPTAEQKVAATNGASPGDHAPPNMAEERRRRIARHELAISRHADEPMDDGWAKETIGILRRDFQRVASEASLVLVDLDCRSRTCLATVEWPSAAVAWQKWSPVLHYSYAAPCGVDVDLGEPQRGDAPFRSVVIFNCRNLPPVAQGEGVKP